MRGLNRVIISGNIGGKIKFNPLTNGAEACSFQLFSDRVNGGSIVTAWVKVNAYDERLVRVCKDRLVKGLYVLVEGELMNRDGVYGVLTEIRAHEIIFLEMATTMRCADGHGA